MVLASVWNENVTLDWESDYEERDRVIEFFRLSRDYEGLVGGINIERNDYIINNRLTSVSYTHLDVYKRQATGLGG